MNRTEPNTWMTLNMAAAYAKVSQATLRREAKGQRLCAYKIGGRRVWRFKATDIDAWLEGTRVEATK